MTRKHEFRAVSFSCFGFMVATLLHFNHRHSGVAFHPSALLTDKVAAGRILPPGRSRSTTDSRHRPVGDGTDSYPVLKVSAPAATRTNGEKKVGTTMTTTPALSIHLVGERHSGTKWMTSHLTRCFGGRTGVKVKSRFTRWKHWFQYEDEKLFDDGDGEGTVVVVAMFRNPYDWTEAMRTRPYHSPNHFDLDWRTFITRPWTMERGTADARLLEEARNDRNVVDVACQHRFAFDEVVPCSSLDRNMYNGTRTGKPIGITYELQHDGSGRPYDSLLDLRRDKIRNFLDMANFPGVRALFPILLEDAVSLGTAKLLRRLEEVTGLEARCEGTHPSEVRQKNVPSEYVRWMNRNVDWETERLIGYSPRE